MKVVDYDPGEHYDELLVALRKILEIASGEAVPSGQHLYDDREAREEIWRLVALALGEPDPFPEEEEE